MFLSLPAAVAHFMTEEEESQSTETTLAEIGEIGVGRGREAEEGGSVLRVIIRVKYAADIIIFWDRRGEETLLRLGNFLL